METQNISKELYTATLATMTIFNIGVSYIVYAFKLPLYLDAIGTILSTLLLGLRAGIITGVLGFIITSLTFNPLAVYFSGTQAVIAIYTFLLGKRGAYRTPFGLVLSGLGLGLTAAIVSAPVIVAVFGGLTGNGPSLITAYLIASGQTVIKSVLITGGGVELIDKLAQLSIAVFLIKGLPKRVLAAFDNDILRKNFLLKDTELHA